MLRLKYVIGIVALLVLLMPSSAFAVADPASLTVEKINTYTNFEQKNVRISWSAVSNASGYMVEVWKDGTEKGQTWVDNSDPRVFTQELYSSQAGTAGSWGKGNYLLRVRAKVGLYWSDGIDTPHMPYVAPKPANIKVISLANGGEVTWDTARDEDNWNYEISNVVRLQKHNPTTGTWGDVYAWTKANAVVKPIKATISDTGTYRFHIRHYNWNIGTSDSAYSIAFTKLKAPADVQWRIPCDRDPVTGVYECDTEGYTGVRWPFLDDPYIAAAGVLNRDYWGSMVTRMEATSAAGPWATRDVWIGDAQINPSYPGYDEKLSPMDPGAYLPTGLYSKWCVQYIDKYGPLVAPVATGQTPTETQLAPAKAHASPLTCSTTARHMP